jgi:hypothetical protein
MNVVLVKNHATKAVSNQRRTFSAHREESVDIRTWGRKIRMIVDSYQYNSRLSLVTAHNSNFLSKSQISILRTSRMNSVASTDAIQPGILRSCTRPLVTSANAKEPVRSCKLFNCERLELDMIGTGHLPLYQVASVCF